MKKELTIKIGFDNETESIADIVNFILNAIDEANDCAMYVEEALIDGEICFGTKGFSGVLRKKFWDWSDSECE